MQQYVCRGKLESIASRTKPATNKFGRLMMRPLVAVVIFSKLNLILLYLFPEPIMAAFNVLMKYRVLGETHCVLGES